MNAPNVINISKRFNSFRALLLKTIVMHGDKANRVKLLKRYIEVATECLNDLHNYETPLIIYAVLNSSIILELKETCREVKKIIILKNQWNYLIELYNGSFDAVRQEMQLNPVVVPCFLSIRQELLRNDTSRKDITPQGLNNILKHKTSS